MTAKCCQTALETAADSIEFPLAIILIKFTNNYRCLDREILSEVKSNEFSVGTLIKDTTKCIRNLYDVMATDLFFLNSNIESHLFYLGTKNTKNHNNL